MECLLKLRGHIGGNCDQVVRCQLCNHWLHELGRGTIARSALKVIHLARYVTRRPARDGWNGPQASEVRTMAGSARYCLTPAAGGNQILALLDAADRYIGDKWRPRVAQYRRFFHI